MSTLFLNPNLTAEEAMDLYKKKVEGMCNVAQQCFDGVETALEKWKKDDAEWDAKFPPIDEFERMRRESQRRSRDFDYRSTMTGLGIQFIIMGLF